MYVIHIVYRKHGGEGLHPLKPWYQTDTVTAGLTCVLAVTDLHFGEGPIIYPTVFLQTNTITALKNKPRHF